MNKGKELNIVFNFKMTKLSFRCKEIVAPYAFYRIKKYYSWQKLSDFEIWNLHVLIMRARILIVTHSKCEILTL